MTEQTEATLVWFVDDEGEPYLKLTSLLDALRLVELAAPESKPGLRAARGSLLEAWVTRAERLR